MYNAFFFTKYPSQMIDGYSNSEETSWKRAEFHLHLQPTMLDIAILDIYYTAVECVDTCYAQFDIHNLMFRASVKI